MNILSWVIFGLIVGIVTDAVDPATSRGSIVGSILLGIAGAVVGGFLTNITFGYDLTGFNVTSFLIAIVGSILLLSIGKAIRKT